MYAKQIMTNPWLFARKAAGRAASLVGPSGEVSC
jgi:hypothetical protein